MARFLRNKKDGFIYDWSEILAENPLCEEVTEQEAFPEKFVPVKQKGRKTGLSLATEEVPVAPAITNEELNLEASKGLPE